METNNDKICKICGDKALNYNFGGLSCETCKIFFRRNAPKYEQLKCKTNTEKCLINSILNRKKCKRCRMNKCLAIGMKKELIYLKKENNQKTSSVKPPVPPPPKNPQLLHKYIYDPSCNLECTVEKLRPIFTEFNETELVRYGEVHRAMSHFPDEFHVPTCGEARDLLHTFNLPALYIRKIIKFCKSIEAFRSLSQDDQITILREFYCEISCLRFAFLFDAEKDAFRVIGNEKENKAVWIQMKVYAEFQRRNNLTSIYRDFFTKLNLEMRNDCKLRNLLIGYFLFNERSSVSCPEFIKTNRSVYSGLLRKYLVHQYPDQQLVERKYSSLMSALNEVSTICHVTREVYASFPTDQLAKVLTEIYHPEHHQLKQPNFSFNFNQIRELQHSIQIDHDKSFELVFCDKQQNLLEILNLGQHYVKKAVKFCGYFSCFKSLKCENQKMLLKNSILELMLAYIAYFFDENRQNGILLIANEDDNTMFVNFEHCQLKNDEALQTFKTYIHELYAEMANDAFTRNLIMIQLLFRPRPSHQHSNTSEYIQYNFTFYRHLLLRYFEYKHNEFAELKYSNILSLIDDMDEVTEAVRHLYTREADTNKLAHLLREIFDV